MGLYKRGKVWWMSFTYNGHQYRRSCETTDKRLAEKIYHKVMTELIEGRYFEKLPGETKTFREMMEKYMKEYSIPRKASFERDRTSLKHLLPFFGDYALLRITPKFINEYKIMRRQNGASSCSINRELALMKHAFNLAVKEWEWVKDNPVKKVSMEKEPSPRDRYLSLEEEEMALAISPEWLRHIIIFAVETGCRQGEIVSLRWKDVDLPKGTVNVYGSKTGEKRVIPLSRRAWEMLKEKSRVRYLATDHVFTADGRPVDRYRLSKTFKSICRRAGIEDMRFHDLRHTFATRLAQCGVDPYTIQRLMGHKTPFTTQRYAHHSVESLRKGIEEFEVRVEQILSQFYHNRGIRE